ncbi:hypothetical protein OH76DRAFT_1413290, partial [Lentinus brumalis]
MPSGILLTSSRLGWVFMACADSTGKSDATPPAVCVRPHAPCPCAVPQSHSRRRREPCTTL